MRFPYPYPHFCALRVFLLFPIFVPPCVDTPRQPALQRRSWRAALTCEVPLRLAYRALAFEQVQPPCGLAALPTCLLLLESDRCSIFTGHDFGSGNGLGTYQIRLTTLPLGQASFPAPCSPEGATPGRCRCHRFGEENCKAKTRHLIGPMGCLIPSHRAGASPVCPTSHPDFSQLPTPPSLTGSWPVL